MAHEFCWMELTTDNSKDARGFYAELFGWSYDDHEMDQGGMARTALFVPDYGWTVPGAERMAGLRAAIRDRHKVRFRYRDAAGNESERVVHPLGLFYWGAVATMGGWCELRTGFRTFRVDRVDELNVLEEGFDSPPGRTLQDYFRALAEEDGGSGDGVEDEE